ncbi:hypothetical protein G0Q06_12050 [Puniceicoccales bacterium CK1056]|uniref:Uncharacterized protein n=1 Tax=Oceanipulchritudo coccoides TaxID=2706888 RepID=A0A6B2M2L2_9BACT|nr:hypothetical protein [Oceanipulchritudo coccoides]NDV63188.1 hypothetical protein [Oceanipulchritudo coccoides]
MGYTPEGHSLASLKGLVCHPKPKQPEWVLRGFFHWFEQELHYKAHLPALNIFESWQYTTREQWMEFHNPKLP